jgi:hypothetical protein
MINFTDKYHLNNFLYFKYLDFFFSLFIFFFKNLIIFFLLKKK